MVGRTLHSVLVIRPQASKEARSFFENLPSIAHTFDFFDSVDDCHGWLRSNRALALVIVLIKDHFQNNKLIGELQELRVTYRLPMLFLTGELNKEILKLLNHFPFLNCLRWPPTYPKLVKALEQIIGNSQQTRAQAELLRQHTEQHRQWQDQAKSLETSVLERTQGWETAKKEAESRELRLRSLVRFVKEIAEAYSLDDLLKILIQDTKTFLYVPTVVYCAQMAGGQHKAFWFQGRTFIERPLEDPWPQGWEIRVDSLADQRFLAKILERPVGRAIALPLSSKENPTNTENYRFPTDSILFFEHSLNSNQIATFIDHVSIRQQPLALAAERIFLEGRVKQAIYQWEATFNGLEDPVAIIDRQYRIVRSNHAFQAKGDFCFLKFGSSPCQGCPLGATLQAGSPTSGTLHLNGKTIEVHSYPIQLHLDGEINGVINHYCDTTAERTLLERVVHHEKMEVLGQLAGNLAHELNNPLTGIKSLTQILGTQCPQGSLLQRDLAEVEKAAVRCQKIISQFNDFTNDSNIDPTGAQESPLESVDLNDLVAKTLPLLKTATRDHRRELQLAEQPLPTRAVPQLLQQVIFNLIHNACQAMSQPGSLTIITRHDEHDNILEIIDSGPGIPEEMLEKIFEPFFTTKAQGEGTGLGLAICRTIIDRFHGKIWAEPSTSGAHFVVSLPRAPIATPVQKIPASEAL